MDRYKKLQEEILNECDELLKRVHRIVVENGGVSESFKRELIDKAIANISLMNMLSTYDEDDYN